MTAARELRTHECRKARLATEPNIQHYDTVIRTESGGYPPRGFQVSTATSVCNNVCPFTHSQEMHYLRVTMLLICLALLPRPGSAEESLTEDYLEDLLKDRTNRKLGGVYVGRVRPAYVGEHLLLQPVGARARNRPGCASRNVMRLEDEPNSTVFRNKFEMVLRAWIAQRELILVGKGTCSLQGEELIFSVISK